MQLSRFKPQTSRNRSTNQFFSSVMRANNYPENFNKKQTRETSYKLTFSKPTSLLQRKILISERF
jgi:hypothetical protein